MNGVLDSQLNKHGILLVGCRLQNARFGVKGKHQVILPYKHHLTDLIIEYFHINAGHIGRRAVLTELRRQYWVAKGRSAVRRVVRRCTECQRRKNKPNQQFIAWKPPFTFVGVDYFGPFEVKQGRSRVKKYGCIVTCTAVRAVHTEIAQSLDVNSMINALRRFISIRGCPEQIRSDCGTNFTVQGAVLLPIKILQFIFICKIIRLNYVIS